MWRQIQTMHQGRDYDSRFGKRMTGTGDLAEALAQRFDATAARLGMTFPGRSMDTSLFRPRGAEPESQGSLF